MTKALDAFIDSGMYIGRMISGSKSGYSQRFPNNVVVFNANICTQEDGKIWYGDLDVTKDSAQLSALAKSLGKEVYVLREMDARFGNEANPKLDRAIAVVHSDGTVEVK